LDENKWNEGAHQMISGSRWIGLQAGLAAAVAVTACGDSNGGDNGSPTAGMHGTIVVQ
jgi:hypothetical protein